MPNRIQVFIPDEEPVYVISVAANLAGLHPQTLRQYDRLGLVCPTRASGKYRLYSMGDIYRLRTVQNLTNEGLNLAGIKKVLELESEIEKLKKKLKRYETSHATSTAIVVWKPHSGA